MQIRYAALPAPTREYVFYAGRRWAFDLAYPPRRLAIEVEGGTFARKPGAASRHTSMAGFREDCLKYGVAALLGWTVLRFTTDMVLSGEALTVIEPALGGDLALAMTRLSQMTRRAGKNRGAWTARVAELTKGV
jgi:hypothetical protein